MSIQLKHLGSALRWVTISLVAVATSRRGGARKLGNNQDQFKTLAIDHRNLVTAVTLAIMGAHGRDITRDILAKITPIMRLITKGNIHSNKSVKCNKVYDKLVLNSFLTVCRALGTQNEVVYRTYFSEIRIPLITFTN